MSMIHPLGTTWVLAVSHCRNMFAALNRVLPMLSHPETPFVFHEKCFASPLRTREELVAKLEKLPPRELRNLVCIVDLTDVTPSSWRFKSEQPGSLRPASLVLAFPEVHFVFLLNNESNLPDFSGLDKELEELASWMKRYHFIVLGSSSGSSNDLGKLLYEPIQRHVYGFRPWYDPTGLRRFLRAEGSVNDMPRAIVMDEEADYLAMNGYVAYHYGYCTQLLPSLNEAKDVLGDNKNPNPDVVLEDREVFYSDVTGADDKNMDITGRTALFPLLNKKNRLIVSSNPPDVTEISDKAPVLKPFGGIFDPVWEKRLINGDEAESESGGSSEQGSERSSSGSSEQDSKRHSAEYMDQAIAGDLLRRALAMRESNSNLFSGLHGALLAAEARKLLGGKTMTLSLEAVQLRHEFEVEAECQFGGVRAELPVARRIKCIQQEVDAILHNMKNDDEKASLQRASILYEIYTRLRKVYSSQGKWEEEGEMLAESRRQVVHFIRQRSAPSWRKAGNRVNAVLYSSVSWMLASIWRILGVSIGFILFGAALWWLLLCCSGCSVPGNDTSFWFFVYSVAKVFALAESPSWLDSMGAGCGSIVHSLIRFSVVVGGALGLGTFGVLISFIYQQVSRR